MQQTSLERVPPTKKAKLLFFSAFAGIFKAIWHGFYEILVSMTNHVSKNYGMFDPKL
jgi:hypothetical protein